MIVRCFLAFQMAAFLIGNPAGARPAVLGVVVVANRVRINTAMVTAGATVYDGDRFSIETRGALRLQDYGATLQLPGESEVTVRSWPNSTHGTEAELTKGTIAFKSPGPTALEVVADEAHIRPASEAKTIAQVRVIDPKQLAICAQRGPLQFSYRGQTETIADGKCYRVILDPTDDVPNPPPAGRPPKAFKIVISIEGAAIVGLGIYELLEPESPDRP